MSEELAVLCMVAGLAFVMGAMFFLGWWVTGQMVTTWGPAAIRWWGERREADTNLTPGPSPERRGETTGRRVIDWREPEQKQV